MSNIGKEINTHLNTHAFRNMEPKNGRHSCRSCLGEEAPETSCGELLHYVPVNIWHCKLCTVFIFLKTNPPFPPEKPGQNHVNEPTSWRKAQEGSVLLGRMALEKWRSEESEGYGRPQTFNLQVFWPFPFAIAGWWGQRNSLFQRHFEQLTPWSPNTFN